MAGTRVTEPMAAIIKLARQRDYKYEVIASYFIINQGRIADVMKGRIAPQTPPADQLPPDFPPAG